MLFDALIGQSPKGNTLLQPPLPRHIAIIMDGNGRWATERRRPRVWGHKNGVESVRQVVSACGEWGIEALTLFAFSAENWGRPALEVATIMELLNGSILRERDELNRNNVRFRTIGQTDRLPEKTQRLIREVRDALSGNTGLTLNIALSYGGRDEIVAAARRLAGRVARGEIAPDDIDANLFSDSLDTAGLPDPDLVIRTSGELRVSNFLLWQLAYAELYFTPVHWPDFRREHLAEAIAAFRSRRRRFGLVETESGDESSAVARVTEQQIPANPVGTQSHEAPNASC